MSRKKRNVYGKLARDGRPYFLGTVYKCRCCKRASCCRKEDARSRTVQQKRMAGLHTRWSNWEDCLPTCFVA
jgi:hypothetical protein